VGGLLRHRDQSQKLRTVVQLIKALTQKATQLQSTFNKNLANAERRVEKYKTEAKDATRRIASLLQKVQKDKEEQRQTVNLLQTNLDTLTKDVLNHKRTLKKRELNWELQLKLSNKEALKAVSDRDTVEAKLAELVEERIQRIDIRESGVRGNPVNEKFARHARGLLASGASARLDAHFVARLHSHFAARLDAQFEFRFDAHLVARLDAHLAARVEAHLLFRSRHE
jgi:hypothetical protein